MVNALSDGKSFAVVLVLVAKILFTFKAVDDLQKAVIFVIVVFVVCDRAVFFVHGVC